MHYDENHTHSIIVGIDFIVGITGKSEKEVVGNLKYRAICIVAIAMNLPYPNISSCDQEIRMLYFTIGEVLKNSTVDENIELQEELTETLKLANEQIESMAQELTEQLENKDSTVRIALDSFTPPKKEDVH